MKNKHYVVTSEMKKRIKNEMKRNGEKNTNISELLSIEPQSFSRILNGNSRLADDYLSDLCKHWGVRKEYLLCNDSVRTENDMFDKEVDEQYDRNKKLIDFLSTIGYEFERVYMLIISPADIIEHGKYYNIDDLCKVLLPYVQDTAQNIELFIDRARNMAAIDYGYHEKHWFNVYPDCITKLYELNALNEEVQNPIVDFYDNFLNSCYRISKNGVVVGYLKLGKFLLIADILERNTENLFTSLLDAFFYQNGAGVNAERL